MLVILVLFTIFTSVMPCGPGRGIGGPRRLRKLTPLVFKQHVPNAISECTLSASGLLEGKITRDDEKFKDLETNYNEDIIFKDDEGTGADRVMTQVSTTIFLGYQFAFFVCLFFIVLFVVWCQVVHNKSKSRKIWFIINDRKKRMCVENVPITISRTLSHMMMVYNNKISQNSQISHENSFFILKQFVCFAGMKGTKQRKKRVNNIKHLNSTFSAVPY